MNFLTSIVSMTMNCISVPCVLLLGGGDPDGLRLDLDCSSCDLFTRQGDRTSFHIPDINDRCQDARVVTVGNTLHILGCRGDGRNNNRMYRLEAGLWQPCAHMVEGVTSFSVATTDSHIVCIGGWETNLLQIYGGTNLLQIYDCSRNSWRLGPSLPVDEVEDAACVVHEGNIVHTGGVLRVNGERQPCSRLVWRLTLAVAGESWQPIAPLVEERSLHVMAVVDSATYVMGGVSTPYSVEVWSEARSTLLSLQLPVMKQGIFSSMVDGSTILLSPAGGGLPDEQQDARLVEP